jgi:hypothetical protein
MIELGKARPAPKMVEVDVTYDAIAEKNLYKAGMKALKQDKQAVIAYAISKTLEGIAKCKK